MRGKLSPRYVGSYEIIQRSSPIAYRLNLLVELEYVHNMFHISKLRKYIPDINHAIVTEPIEVTKDIAYEECPVQIVDHRIKQLCNKQIPLIKYIGQIIPP